MEKIVRAAAGSADRTCRRQILCYVANYLQLKMSVFSVSFRAFASVLIMAGGICCSFPARAAVINGHGYQPLADWADANGFQTVSRRGDEITLAGHGSRLVFDKDSHMAQINGVNVALSFPVAVDKGHFLIASLDLVKTVGPLLFPPKFADKEIHTICLDPGHGGKDPGNRVGWHSEKNYTLPLALELRRQLEAAGFKVILTRTKDEYVELPERPDIANRRHADLFVSLHFNATVAGKADVEGPETYCITPVGAASSNSQGEGANHGPTPANADERQSLLLAYQVQKALVKNLGVDDRGVRRARFAVLRDAQMPAILVESGYMTHPVEGKKIFSAAYRKQLATAIMSGILAYQKLTAPAVENSVGATPKKSWRHSEHETRRD
jgi:N-acetylmuramoyl-L-alanine amidase